jgi:hypothetical protein
MKIRILISITIIGIIGIGCRNDERFHKDYPEINPVAIGENSFVYNQKVYKVINNELLQIGDLNDTAIRKLKISNSELKDLGATTLDFIKANAEAKVSSLYRGNFLYYKIILIGINDLKENYRPGKFTIDFRDEYGFSITSVSIYTSDIIGGVIGGKVVEYEYYGKIEMNQDIQTSIKSYDISSTVAKNKL